MPRHSVIAVFTLLLASACGTGSDGLIDPDPTPQLAGHANVSTNTNAGSITGILRGYRPNGADSSATPIAGASIQVLQVTGAGGPTQRTIQHSGCNRAGTVVSTLTTGSDGAFSALGLPAGNYDLRMTPPAGLPYAVTAFCNANVSATAGIHLQIYLLRQI